MNNTLDLYPNLVAFYVNEPKVFEFCSFESYSVRVFCCREKKSGLNFGGCAGLIATLCERDVL